ncbi:MAG: exodeoxyribonuclease V subunit alpha [Alphaproteobacteria bacterium]|nr:exodeoxyribonuclease V subunit alpha [Alphaproteobacteria bacterium]MCB9696266.1 exodeoxyribonuclease V subunit alpha [Alphaproteobacteria bacterium]
MSLRALQELGLLDGLDVRFARALGRLGGTDDDRVLLAAALANRAPRVGHVGIEFRAAHTLSTEEHPLELPDPDDWEAAVVACTTLVRRPDEARRTPLVVADGALYLDRYWDYQRRLADAVRARLDAPPPTVDEAWLQDALDTLFPADPRTELQRRAAEVAVRRRLTLVVGGPGTGKTAVVVKLLALLAGSRTVLVAPTGKAAARLSESLRENAARWLTEDQAEALTTDAATLHRALGLRPGDPRPRHGPDDPLAADVVVVDEASMVDLPLMTKLFEAVPPHARLILLGDPDQLVSVELGSVLGDLCQVDAGPLARTRVRLEHTWRYAPDSGIGVLAEAIRRGDVDAAVSALTSHDDLTWIREPPTADALQATLVDGYRPVFDATDPKGALQALKRFRVLCAHRHGRLGVAGVQLAARQALEDAGLAPPKALHRGLPVMVTRNDARLGVYNGDVGVVHPDPSAGGALRLWLEQEGEPRSVSLALVPEHDAVYATTVHKSQGSEYDHVYVLLPDRPSPLLTRELLYTAVTRARRHVTLVGRPELVESAIRTVTQRMSGLPGMLS